MDQIGDDHRALRALLDQLDQQMSDANAKSLTPLLETLESLTQGLAAHFKREEVSDLYVGVPQRVPALAAALADLRVDHGTLLELVIDARGAAERLDASRTELTELVTGLVGRLSAHERAESEIMQRAFAAE